MGTATAVVVLVANVPIFIGIGWCFFGNWQGFLINLLTSGKALLLGTRLFDEENEDFWEPFKLLIFLISCAAVVYVEYLGLQSVGWA